MKLRKTAIVLTAIMMMCASGCANSEKNENADKSDKTEKSNSSVVTTTVANTVSMPEPIPVPEGGWTDETIKDVIYINGKNLQFPCTIDDLGDGFEIELNEEADKEMKEDGSAVYHLNYCGDFVGFVGMRESDKIYLLDFDAFDSPIENYPDIPFSVNGVTIGTPISEVREIMGKDFSDEKDNGHFKCDFDNFWVSMYDAYNNDKISSIEIFSH